LRGGAIRLTHSTELTALTDLHISEGLEDGLSMLVLGGDCPVWAAPGATFLEQVKIPQTCRSVTIGADRDANGQKSALALAERLSAGDIKVSITTPPSPFKDWNEYHMSNV
jgi:hypothetical protein